MKTKLLVQSIHFLAVKEESLLYIYSKNGKILVMSVIEKFHCIYHNHDQYKLNAYFTALHMKSLETAGYESSWYVNGL